VVAADARQTLTDWLLGPARAIADPVELVPALADRLAAVGVHVARITTGVPILHPQLFSSSTRWERGKEAVELRFQAEESGARPGALERSPINAVYQGGGPIRCRPGDAADRARYPIVADLHAAGITDYLVMPAPFSDGSAKAMTFASDREGGFTDNEVATIEAIIPALTALLEVQALKRTALTLLETYVGRQTGRRVLAGQIRRGMGETVRAVIWLNDLRGFTGMSERLPGGEVIALLNDYFGAMCAAVEDEGGEVLKFIGDAMLAIFALPADGDAVAACARARRAAKAAAAAVDEINASRRAAERPAIAYGLALHIGEVIYGNIGSETRLDFTVIGPAVNLAARIEGLCRELKRAPLYSHAFAAAAGPEAGLVPLGDFALKGVAARETVYGEPG
jgi:adenylate cyclase